MNDYRILNGLNNSKIAIKTHEVKYLHELESDGRKSTNLYMHNGYITAAHSLEETIGLLQGSEDDDSEQIEKWKKQAKARQEAKIEMEAIKSKIFENVNQKIVGWEKTINADEIIYTVRIDKETEKQNDN